MLKSILLNLMIIGLTDKTSTKLLKTGFTPKFKVEDAIKEVKNWYLNNKKINFNKFYTVKWMKKLGYKWELK